MICELHNKILKTWFIITDEMWCWKPDKEVSLGVFAGDIAYLLLFPIFLIMGLLIRGYNHLPYKINVFSNTKFKCKKE